MPRRLAILVPFGDLLARRMRRQVKGRLSAGFDWRVHGDQAQKGPAFRADQVSSQLPFFCSGFV